MSSKDTQTVDVKSHMSFIIDFSVKKVL